MPIRIVKATDVITIDQIIMCIYALPGIGKTTLGQSADDPLTLDFDKGIHRAKNRRDSIPVTSWADVEDLDKDDVAPYSTLVIDTAGRMVDAIGTEVMRENPDRGKGGGLDLKGWGMVKTRFIQWSNKMKSWGKDIVLISHLDEREKNDITQERLDIQGGAKGEIYKTADIMGRLYVEGRFRKLDFNPRQGSLGKNPCQLEVLSVPSWQQDPNWLGDLIRNVKQTVNSQNAKQTESAIALLEWREKFSHLDSLDQFNRTAAQLQEGNAEPEVRFALTRAAAAYSLVMNKTTKRFEEAPDADE